MVLVPVSKTGWFKNRPVKRAKLKKAGPFFRLNPEALF
jgi:hypothetical protein